jgi:hypothetical protein
MLIQKFSIGTLGFLALWTGKIKEHIQLGKKGSAALKNGVCNANIILS